MATSTVNEPNEGSFVLQDAFQNFSSTMLSQRLIDTLDKMGYYLVLSSNEEQQMMHEINQLLSVIVDAFDTIDHNIDQFKNQLNECLGAIEAYFDKNNQILMDKNLNMEIVDTKIKQIQNWLTINEPIYPYLIVTEEYELSPVNDDTDKQIIKNIQQVKLYESGETQIKPTIYNQLDAYVKQLALQIGSYKSNIKLYQFKLEQYSNQRLAQKDLYTALHLIFFLEMS